MMDLPAMILFDLSIVVSFFVLAYLSRKMGDALKIPPYYRVLYFSAFLTVVASGLDVAVKGYGITCSPIITLVMRVCAGAAAIGICLRYWGWLFSEFF
jgi:hypothetical protein